MLDFSTFPALLEPDDLPNIDVDADDLTEVCNDIRIACGWHIAPRVEALPMVVNANGGTVLTVPSLKINEPLLVVDSAGRSIVDYTWSDNGILEGNWPAGLRSVTVTADSGFGECPPSIKAVIKDMLRDRVNASSGGGIAQVRLDDADVVYANPYAPRSGAVDVGVRRDLMAAYGHVLSRYSL